MPIPNLEMADQARQGLELRREYGRGGTAVGVARARDIMNRRDLSMDTVRRMHSFFARHGANFDEFYGKTESDGGPNAFTIAWKLWGGTAGQDWAALLVDQDDERAETRPYYGEHAARIKDPDLFENFSRVNDQGGSGIDFIFGIYSDGSVDVQAIRFDADMYSEDDALEWLARNDFTVLEFEPAIPEDHQVTENSSKPDAENRHIKSVTETDDEIIIVFGKSEMYDDDQPEIDEAGYSYDKDEKREYRPASHVEVRAEHGSKMVRVAGYAAVFDEETNIGGMFNERIARGAFSNAIGRDDVVFLINHDGLPLARTRSGTLTLREDDRGLYMEAMLDMSDPDVQSIVPKMKRGDLDKMSFAFVPVRQSWDEDQAMPTRTIEEAQLYDVSIVTTPAYNATEIGLRSMPKKTSQSVRKIRMMTRLLTSSGDSR